MVRCICSTSPPTSTIPATKDVSRSTTRASATTGSRGPPSSERNVTARRYLITGGAGFVGSALVAALNEPGALVRRMVRRGTRPAAWPGPAMVEDVEGDVTVRADVERAVDGVDVIFHL